MTESGDSIELEGLEVECIVGVHAHEREAEQPVRVDITLNVDLRAAGSSGRIDDTVDYDQVAREVELLLKFRRYRLLEVAAHELSAMIFGVHPEVQRVALRLCKPVALRGRARGAAIRLARVRADFAVEQEDTVFGTADTLLETAEAGLYLLHVGAGREIPVHHHNVMQELEWRVAGELERDGTPLEGLAPVQWPLGRRHGYRNRSDQVATLFCCAMPPFVASDEVVEAPP